MSEDWNALIGALETLCEEEEQALAALDGARLLKLADRHAEIGRRLAACAMETPPSPEAQARLTKLHIRHEALAQRIRAHQDAARIVLQALGVEDMPAYGPRGRR